MGKRRGPERFSEVLSAELQVLKAGERGAGSVALRKGVGVGFWKEVVEVFEFFKCFKEVFEFF